MRFIGLVGSIVALVAGCSSAPGGDATGDGAGGSNEAISTCGVTPKAPVCNVPRCTADGWISWPIAKGAACTVNGQAGTCDGGKVSPGEIEPDAIGKCIVSHSGSIKPKFYVLSVVYAPPGTSSATAPKSTVTYANGSTAGTSIKISSSFKTALTDQAEATLAGFATINASTGYSVTQASDDELAMKKSTSLTIIDTGPSADGLNHDDDLLYIWLNPLIDIVGSGNTMKWSMSNDGAAMDIQYVSVGQLKNPSTIPPGVLSRFAAYGITSVDYPTMLGRDPFAYGSTAIDANRYVQTWTTLPYEPPLAAGDVPAQAILNLNDETTHTQTNTTTTEWSVGYSVKVGAPDFTSWLGASVTTAGTFTWTNATAATSTTTSTQAATAAVTGPSFGYAGPTDMAVYYDTFYGTFLFAPLTGRLTISGVVTDTLGHALSNEEVIVQTSAGPLRTVTGPRGDYRIFGAAAGRATITVGGVSHVVTVGSGVVQQNVSVTPRLVVGR